MMIMPIEYNFKGKELARDIIRYISENGGTTFAEVCEHFPEHNRKEILKEMKKLNKWQLKTTGYDSKTNSKIWRVI